ncbi:hypothetical protein FDC45_03940 [Clostridium botulinum]|uniref:Uncharacterized protein n=1 Tax=Clostridium botulinum TaxID=1491 RepID=A0A846J7A4_CLOBO|nr:hypothetical protein [Clostridium botulinum]ACA54853.1 hypothetical protein CLK_2693 [Clostridium botulinum A3 str. Loch Maree]NFH65279.1 hypothetical protein [Clostridium botulinum]NFJ09060.1 hypothetical protein [Clostridium botulinum]NFK16328.1 hypothetical protein [Clostridium botulinum]NFM92371.1 hypothetical protein [Clostridium botulinum]
MKEIDRYDGDYPYKKSSVFTGKSEKGYPIIERLNNGLVFPEGPQERLEFKDMKMD